MFRSTTIKWIVGVVGAIVVLGLLRFKPWQDHSPLTTHHSPLTSRQVLRVGFLPVT